MKGLSGHSKARIGTALVWQGNERVETAVYSGDKLVSELMRRDGTNYDEAIEYVLFNIEDAYVGKDTPIIVWNKRV